MRPQSIVLFERFFLASLILGVINSALSFNNTLALMNADPAAAQLGFGAAFIVGTLVFSVAIQLALWFFIARTASDVAKWILLALTALGIVMALSSMGTLAQQGTLTLVLALFIMLLQIIAIVMLFRADAKAWFAAKGRTDTNPDVFR